MILQNLIRSTVLKLPLINWGNSQYDDSYLILKWGENPYPLPTPVRQAMIKSLDQANRYPTQMARFKTALGTYNNIEPKHIVLVNGTTKAFRIIAETFINQGDQAITFTPSFPVFDVAIKMMGGQVISLPLNHNFQIPPVNEIINFVKPQTKLIYLCQPNNPTGNFMATEEQIKSLLKLNCIILVDEAYSEFSGCSCQHLLKDHPNLIIMRSFSKTFALAGLRVGYILSALPIVNAMLRIEQSIEVFNIANTSLAGALAALENIDLIQKNMQKINKTRKKLTIELTNLGIQVYPSFTSFIMCNLKSVKIESADFVKRMSQEKIIIKDASIYTGLNKYHTYIAIPAEEHLTRVLSAVKKIISRNI